MKHVKGSVLFRSALVAVSVFACGASATAAELTVGARWEPVMDPHFAWSGANSQFYRQYLGHVAYIGPNDEADPGIGTFEPIKDTIWEIKVNPKAKFDNGAEVMAEDVVASFNRARNLPNAIGSYKGLFAGVTDIKAVDAKTVHVESSKPIPTFPNALTQIAILPKEICETATQEDFNSKKGNVGAAAYSFEDFVRGDKIILVRNPDYFGPKAVWDKVTFKLLKNGATRVAGLLAGELDVIDGVPPSDAKKIAADERFAVHSGASDRTVFLGVDMARDVSTSVTDDSGKPISPNPLKDLRVRQALALSINRDAIKDRVMDGFSYPNNQLVPPSIGGYSKAIPAPKYDPAAAKKLLADAGFPNGFNIRLQCPTDRYVNSAQICQVLGQMFTRVGIRTVLDTAPYAVYSPKVRSDERGALYMASWGASGSGEADVLRNVFHTKDPTKGLGTWNHSGYSNPEVDKLIEDSMGVLDKDERRARQAKAMEALIADVGVIPLHTQAIIVATKKGLNFTTYADESTFADSAVPVK